MKLSFALGLMFLVGFAGNDAFADPARSRDRPEYLDHSTHHAVDYKTDGRFIVAWDKRAPSELCNTLTCPRFMLIGIGF